MDSTDLSPEDKRALVRLVRRSLEEFLDGVEPAKSATSSPALERPRATFVTLRRSASGELRGCRGEIHASRPLVESVVRMAIVAATDDPRFPPVTREELPALQIEISALTPLRPIEPGEVDVGRHGLMISKGLSSGLLLPQAAVHYGWSREEFLRMLCRKAGLPDDAWKSRDSRLMAFEAEVWGEEG